MEKNHKNAYWFKRRRYGFGWVPVTRYGWLSIVVFIAVLFVAAIQLPLDDTDPTTGQMTTFLVIVALDVLFLVLVTIKKGPSPRWRWGKKPGDNPDEDF